MSGPADEGFGAHPFGEIARATVATQERSLELAQAWSGSLQQLISDQAEAFGSMVQGWNDAFLRLLEAGPWGPAEAAGAGVRFHPMGVMPGGRPPATVGP